MNANDPIIIDVTPLKSSRTRSTAAGNGQHASSNSAYSAGAWQAASNNWQHTAAGNAYGSNAQRTVSTGNATTGALQSRLGGLVQMLVGAFLVMIGVPMLILPGPGLLSIIAGLALAASGYRKFFGAPVESWFTVSRYPR